MTQIHSLRHEFITTIPEVLDPGVLYVSIPYAVVAHGCCCGCGNEVVTPLDPNDWELTFNGKSISLSPSIGNGGLFCQSHYWIRHNRVVWLPRISKEVTDSREKQISFSTLWKSLWDSLMKICGR